MWTLGIETSGRAGSVALVREGTVTAERQLAATGRRHARSLVPEIASLLSETSLRVQDLNVIAVSIGPGSFTGLRVGVVCAKTLAYALGEAHLVAVDTFLAVAAAAPEDVNGLWVIDDALRGDVFVGEYVRTDQGWGCSQRPKLISLEEWQAGLSEGTAVSGPGVDKLRRDLGVDVNVVSPEHRLPQACQIALLGEAAACAGKFDNPWTLEPFYIRRSAAEEKTADPSDS